MVDLSCKLTNKITLKNPLVLVSGVSGNSDTLLIRAAKSGASAITTKSCTLKYRPGTNNPVSSDWGCGLLTNLGLTNPGADSMAYMINSYRQKISPEAVPVIANIYAETPQEYAILTGKILSAQPDIIECVLPEYDQGLVSEITAAVHEAAGDTPISIKLSAVCSHIGQIAASAWEAGADMITAVNPIPGMQIDVYAGKPFLSSGGGWITGPALKPIALKCIADIYHSVDIPIIGMGGIMTGMDMVEMIMAGASVVGLGSALHYHGYKAFKTILSEFEIFMESEGYKSPAEICGKIWR